MGAVTSSMAAKFAFFPPSPTYTIEQDAETGKLMMIKTDPEENENKVMMSLKENADVIKLKTKKCNEIVAVFFRNPSAKLTVLYSHGNAADLGQLFELFGQLSIHLCVNVMGYDYSGYGQSSGKPSEQNTYADIDSVFKCLVEKYNIHEENIILYGQSVGSGPTLDLAVHLPRLRAVVLHSAILSGLRVMYPVKHSYWFDIYKNIDKIPRVSCPVLVIHGTADRTVDFSHGQGLYELCWLKYEPLWIDGGDHCNLERYPQYLLHLKEFISAMEKVPRGRSFISIDVSAEPKSSFDRSVSRRSVHYRKEPKEKRRASTGSREKPRKSSDKREKARVSTDKRETKNKVRNFSEQPRSSIDLGEKPMNSVDREEPRKSSDSREKGRASTDKRETESKIMDQPEKPRTSIEWFGGVVKSVALCNIDCFKPPHAGTKNVEEK